MYKLSSILTRNTRGLITTSLTLIALQITPQALAFGPTNTGPIENCTLQWDHATPDYICLGDSWLSGAAPIVNCAIPISELELCEANPEDPNCYDPLLATPIFEVPEDSCLLNGGSISTASDIFE